MTSAPADLTVHLDPPPGWVQIPQEPDADGTVLMALAPGEWSEDLGVRPSIVVALGAPTAECRIVVTDRDDVAIYVAELTYRSDCIKIHVNLLDREAAATPKAVRRTAQLRAIQGA